VLRKRVGPSILLVYHFPFRPVSSSFPLSMSIYSPKWFVEFIFPAIFFYFGSLRISEIMSKQRVLLLGATGETGGDILNSLVEDGGFVSYIPIARYLLAREI